MEIEKRYGYPVLPDDQLTRERLRRAGEQAKIDLSDPNRNSTLVKLRALDLGSSRPFDVRIKLTRAQLEECAKDVIQRTLLITSRAIQDIAGLSWNQIDEVILVGGQTLMPAVQREVEALTGRKPRVNDRPQLAVALGAGEYAHILSLGREKFQKNTLINVIALPLGIRLDENTFKPLVHANVTLPHASDPYPITTPEDNQTAIHVEVLQGAREDIRADQCVLLGSIDMEVPPAPARTTKFEVVFDVQSDGTMKVIVTDIRRRRQGTLDIVEGKRILVWRDVSQKEEGGAADIIA
jgi:molecular chaperone DnaK